MADRRYDEQEVAAIFRRAAEGSPSPAPREGGERGLTLRDLQAIGREVGIAEDAVTRAALALDARAQGASRRLLGLPIGVGRTILLDRWLSDAEWDLLVVRLREVFGARGTVRADGSLREWRNGNLQALLEPTPTGHRLRLTTLKGSAVSSFFAGTVALGVAAAVTASVAIAGTLSDSLPGILFLATVGLGFVANGALQLPGWARLRSRQMEGIAEYLADEGPAGLAFGPPSAENRRP